MKRIIIIMALSLTVVIFSHCVNSKKIPTNNTGEAKATKTEQFNSNKLTAVVDGNIIEWQDNLFNYDNNTKCRFALANDVNNIYLAIKCLDQMQALKIIEGGVEVWLDSKVKKNKTIAVMFPLGGGTLMPPSNSNERPDIKKMRAEAQSKLTMMTLIGFKAAFNGLQPIYSPSQVKPVIDWDEKNNLIYELAIPFSSLSDETLANLTNLSVGIIIKALKLPEGGPGGGGFPGGGMPPGGIVPGGGNMPDMNQIQNLMKDNSFWTKYKINKG